MKRRTLLYLAAGSGAALAGAGVALWRRSQVRAEGGDGLALVPDALWALRFEPPSGDAAFSLQDWRGRPLVINFWATWCPPCVKELPLLDEFARNQREAGVQVLGLAVDGPTPVREFLARQPVSFPVGLAGLDGVDIGRQLGNTGGQLPYTVWVDARGRVVLRHLGALNEADLSRGLAAIL
jgi:thiol-disulfide isomerase/thioredoxin